MDLVMLRDHFDGTKILLDEPVELEPNTELLVTILRNPLDEEREAWSQLALESLSRAYSDDEPDYPLSSLKSVNPDYEGR